MDPLRDSAAQASNNFPAPIALALIVVGIYLWEFFSNLHYEWDVIRGRRPYRWTICVYLISRWAALAITIVTLVQVDVTSPSSCQASNPAAWVSDFLAQGSASLLIVLRVFAIWNKNKVIAAISATVWATNLSFLLLGTIRIRTVPVPATGSCIPTNVETSVKPTCISLVVTDFVLLLIMLAGLLRYRRRGSSSFELWQFLWKQGVIWLAIATVAELPPAVFLILNINVTLDVLFLYPSPIIMVIAATRIHRALQNYVSLTPAGNSAPDTNGLQNTQSSCEEYTMSQINHCGSYPASDKPHKIGVDDDV